MSETAPFYPAMSDGDMLAALGDDAVKWADAFTQCSPHKVPHDLLVAWFANAIENSSDVRRSRLIHDDEAWSDHVERIGREREIWREIKASETLASLGSRQP